MYHFKSIFTLSRTLKDKMESLIFHIKASTVIIELLLENIKSMSLQHKSLFIKHTSKTSLHNSKILNIRTIWISQSSMSLQQSSITLQHSSMTLHHSSMLISQSSMELPHTSKYGYFKSMRTCFTLISIKTGAIFSLSFFRQYKVCLIRQNEETKQQITKVFSKVLADGSNSAMLLSFSNSFGRRNTMRQ